MKKLHPCPDVPTGCACRCHAIGLARSSQGATHPNAWTKAHDALLLELCLDGVTVTAIADRLTERFGISRTPLGVRQRLKKLGASRRDGWWTLNELVEVLGTSRRTLVTAEQAGLLPGAEYGRWRRYRAPDVEAFVKQAAGRIVNPARVRDPRLRSLAEVSARVNARAGA